METQPPPLKAEVNLIHPVRMLITGPCGSGKTFTACHLINNVFRPQIERLISICPTWYTQDCFEPIHDLINRKEDAIVDLNGDVFGKLFDDLFKVYALRRKEGKEPIKTLVFIDDLAGTSLIHGGRVSSFAHFAIQLRPLKCSCILLSQQPTAVSPAYRDNVSDVIAFASTRKEDKRWLIREYCSFKMTEQTMNQLIETAWGSANEEDGIEEDHFIFIHKPPRQKITYYANFDYSLNPVLLSSLKRPRGQEKEEPNKKQKWET